MPPLLREARRRLRAAELTRGIDVPDLLSRHLAQTSSRADTRAWYGTDAWYAWQDLNLQPSA